MILLIISLFAFIKLRYRFWYLLPLNHYYNIFSRRGIICQELPEKNKYTNTKNVRTYYSNKLHKNDIKHINTLLNININEFLDCISFVSLYLNKEYLTTNKSIPIQRNKIIGCIASIPLNVILHSINLDVYYFDFFYAKKQNIEEQLFQTHIYNQSRLNKSISVYLFHKETKLKSVIPILQTKNFHFNLLEWTQPSPLDGCLSLVVGDKQNLYYFYNFFKGETKWDLSVVPEVSHIINMVTNKKLFIMLIMQSHEILAVYIFKHIDDNQLLLISSIQGKIETRDFIKGFHNSLKKIVSVHIYKTLIITNLAHNSTILEAMEHRPTSMKDTYYYFYNYSYPTQKPNASFLIL